MQEKHGYWQVNLIKLFPEKLQNEPCFNPFRSGRANILHLRKYISGCNPPEAQQYSIFKLKTLGNATGKDSTLHILSEKPTVFQSKITDCLLRKLRS